MNPKRYVLGVTTICNSNSWINENTPKFQFFSNVVRSSVQSVMSPLFSNFPYQFRNPMTFIFILSALYLYIHFFFTAETNPDALKTKKSELRLYCDLLMQQVHLVKTSATSKDGPEVEV